MSPGGTAVIPWRTTDTWRIWANRYDGFQWTGPVDLGEGYRPKVTADSAGNAVVAYLDLTDSLKAREYTEESGWLDEVEIGSDWCAYHDLSMNADGVATVVWQGQDAAGFTIWANRGEWHPAPEAYFFPWRSAHQAFQKARACSLVRMRNLSFSSTNPNG